VRKTRVPSPNVYTCSPAGGLLGWATLPSNAKSLTTQDGIVLNFRMLPGGSFSPYNVGDPATHGWGTGWG